MFLSCIVNPIKQKVQLKSIRAVKRFIHKLFIVLFIFFIINSLTHSVTVLGKVNKIMSVSVGFGNFCR